MAHRIINTSSPPPPLATARRPRPHLKTALRGLILLITAAAIGYLVYQSADQLRAKRLQWDQIDWVWWGGAVVVYIAAMSLAATFWYAALRGLGQRPPLGDCYTAFFVSQLGKYVPGKAMVVIIRTDWIRGPEVAVKPAVASVFVETLSWIFVGSAIASLMIVGNPELPAALRLTAISLTVIAGLLTAPPIFGRLASKLARVGDSDSRQRTLAIRWPTMISGWLLLSAGWVLNGWSLWLVVGGLPGVDPATVSYGNALACVALATVAGFVSLIPGGLGVRELVIIPVLGTSIGSANAILAAVVIRLIWLASELAAAGILYLGHRILNSARRSASDP